jgi:dGTPase
VKNTFYNAFDTENINNNQLKRKEGDYRTPFQVDRDRIIFSYVFRRLQSKTQLFRSGEYDFYRTRLTHSIEVARIGRSICDYLKEQPNSPLSEHYYIDPDLTEALGLAHDLGHPPFGHIGERELNKLMAPYGGFEGNAQTLRIVTELMYERKNSSMGMNPTRAFLDGILKYKKLFKESLILLPNGETKYADNHFIYNEQETYRNFVFGDLNVPAELMDEDKLNGFKSIECQIMDWADDTAYSLHDLLDGINSGFITQATIERWAENQNLSPAQQAYVETLLESMKKGNTEPVFSNKIGVFIQACSLETTQNCLSSQSQRYAYNLKVAPYVQEECEVYKSIAAALIFRSSSIQQVEFKGRLILNRLFKALYENYAFSDDEQLKILPTRVSNMLEKTTNPHLKMRLICDFLADLTDKLAIKIYRRLFDPEYTMLMTEVGG